MSSHVHRVARSWLIYNDFGTQCHEVSRLVQHILTNGIHEVGGSIPPGSTNKNKGLAN
jgi:hypothetical protein